MPKFEIVTYATAQIRETWHVEAADIEAAKDMVMGENDGPGLTFIEDEVIGGETEREVADQCRELTEEEA